MKYKSCYFLINCNKDQIRTRKMPSFSIFHMGTKKTLIFITVSLGWNCNDSKPCPCRWDLYPINLILTMPYHLQLNKKSSSSVTWNFTDGLFLTIQDFNFYWTWNETLHKREVDKVEGNIMITPKWKSLNFWRSRLCSWRTMNSPW